ncbi:cysteine--tRNA ligase [endosymbiont of Sipalinus gigas]|uniref:cysteine--tRNA ligase n=1 Tax=endosymbiont of Sipalinus gigas TaxID=1972134 RepID=UPI000DC72176|nr:cysteine--tRNA ligase [endosymbiont of Sipalinus gigas]BBA85315.1 cysteine--tRNA ligase [endosymbiont of Sipalinus gigas]
MINIFNTFTKKKEKISFVKNSNMNIYVCGITAYDRCHLGHGRLFIIFDILIKYLKYLGYKINYVRNITDIDDKIINILNLSKINIDIFVNKIISQMYKDLDHINILRPNIEPKVRENINLIINNIDILIKNNNAYINNGNVLFSVNSFNKYGILSNQKLSLLKENLNIINKNDKSDFFLWKKTEKNDKYYWKTKWGNGRPGWHIECTALSNKFLNNNINIHGGGIDLLFPHHENELAQSFCILNRYNVDIWMHVGSVNMFNKKMSKSNGNFVYLDDIYKIFHKETIIHYLIGIKHYRKSLNFDFNTLKVSDNFIRKLYILLYENNFNIKKTIYIKNEFMIKFYKYINDDLDIPKICSLLLHISEEIVKFKNKINIINMLLNQMVKISNFIGLLKSDPNDFFNFYKKKNKININCIENLINKRNIEREKKNWKIADDIRSYLISNGIIIEDNKNKTKWKFR